MKGTVNNLFIGFYLKLNIPGGKQLHGQRRQTNKTGESF